ncbi:MAG TPA: hypothetical protein DCR35_12375 [Runella sp.]|nr:hypothetical protein [Runella sp.]HAO50026.1 hypothetical protein [Runella sp.]
MLGFCGFGGYANLSKNNNCKRLHLEVAVYCFSYKKYYYIIVPDLTQNYPVITYFERTCHAYTGMG